MAVINVHLEYILHNLLNKFTAYNYDCTMDVQSIVHRVTLKMGWNRLFANFILVEQ